MSRFISSRLSVSFVVALCALGVGGCLRGTKSELARKHFAKGQVLVLRGELDAALEELAKAIEADPDLSVAYTAMGDVYRRQHNYELAAHSYETACEKNPYAFRAHYNLGFTYQVLADATKIAELAQQYLRRAADVYARALELRPDDFETNLNISVCYFDLGRDDLAEQYCVRAIEIDPRNPQAYNNLGIIYERQKRYYQAIRAYKASLELAPRRSDVLMNLGGVYVKQDRLAAAISAFKMAAKIDESNPAPWEKLGACYYRQRHFDQAVEAYEKALQIDPKRAAAHRGLGVIYMTQYILDQKQTEKRDLALAAWNRSLEIDPDQPKLAKLVKKYTPAFAGPNM